MVWLAPMICMRSAIVVLAMAVTSRAGAGDLCKDNDEMVWELSGASFNCWAVVMGEVAPYGITCETGHWGSLCPLACGKCELVVPDPDCTPAEIAENKGRACQFLVDTKLKDDCVVQENLSWQDHKYAQTEKTLFHQVDFPAFFAEVPGDPCSSGPLVCDRCGEVRSCILGWPRIVDFAALPQVTGGEFPDVFFTFKKLNLFLWKSTKEPLWRMPANRRWSEFPALGLFWVEAAFPLSTDHLSGMMELHYLVTSMTLGGRFDHMLLSPKLSWLVLTAPYDLRDIAHYLMEAPVTGSLPDSICAPNLRRLWIELPDTDGPLPSCLENLAKLDTIMLFGRYHGPVATLLASAELKEIHVSEHSNLSGPLPSSLSSMTKLESLSIVGQPLGGTVPDITSPVLRRLTLAYNSLEGVGALTGDSCRVNLAGNAIESWPGSFNDLPGVQILILDNNPLAEWPPAGVYPEWAITSNSWVPSIQPIMPRFVWPDMKELSVDNCPLDVPLREFLASLSYVNVESISARGCLLHGRIQKKAGKVCVLDFQLEVLPMPAPKCGLIALDTLHLDYNQITGVEVWMPSTTRTLTLNYNNLGPQRWCGCNGSWPGEEIWGGAILNVQAEGNPNYRINVEPPPADGMCPASRVGGLIADPHAFRQVANDPHGIYADKECTKLCNTGFFPKLDPTANSTLCRPLCDVGSYRETATSPNCTLCHQWPFRTTDGRGALGISSCVCNSKYTGLRAIGDQCGCHDGYFMNHVTKSCTKCNAVEMCTWSTEIGMSLAPPEVKPGYWMVGTREPLGHFSGHDIWRCTSETTCGTNGKCAPGRGGLACSLCLPGKFGGPDGECMDCPDTPRTQMLYITFGVLCCTPVALMLHSLLADMERSETVTEGFLLLRSVRTSFRQLVRQIQAVSIVSGFQVKWPELAKTFFGALRKFSVALPSWAGAACLGDQQTASLEMGFRWMTPVVLIVPVLLAIPTHRLLVRLSQRFFPGLLTKLCVAPTDKISLWDAVRTYIFGCVMFYPTLLEYASTVFVCAVSPNGRNTVKDFPHLECSIDNSEYVPLAIVSMVFAIVVLGALFGSIAFAFFSSLKLWAQNREERGWWKFLFTDFRDAHTYWALMLMLRDMLFVATAVVFVGDGAAQLLTTAVIGIVMAVLAAVDAPYVDRSNTVLEIWNSASIALICVYSAGMGYHSTPGVSDSSLLYDGGEQDPVFKTREYGMLSAQLLAFTVPAVIIFYQLLLINQSLRKFIPSPIRPLTREEQKGWVSAHRKTIEETVGSVMDRFDPVDFGQFRSLMDSSTATIGVLGSGKNGYWPSSWARNRASASSISLGEPRPEPQPKEPPTDVEGEGNRKQTQGSAEPDVEEPPTVKGAAQC